MAAAWREKWAKKAHFCGGLSVRDVPSLPLYCKGKHMFRPVCSSSLHQCARGRFPFFRLRHVTAAFYKVRDSSAGMCIRISTPRSILPFFLPPSCFPRTIFPRAIVFAPPALSYPDRDRDAFQFPFDVSVSRGVCEIRMLALPFDNVTDVERSANRR